MNDFFCNPTMIFFKDLKHHSFQEQLGAAHAQCGINFKTHFHPEDAHISSYPYFVANQIMFDLGTLLKPTTIGPAVPKEIIEWSRRYINIQVSPYWDGKIEITPCLKRISIHRMRIKNV